MNPPPAGAGPSPPGRPACAAACRGWTRPSSARESLSGWQPWLPLPPCPHHPAGEKNEENKSLETAGW